MKVLVGRGLGFGKSLKLAPSIPCLCSANIRLDFIWTIVLPGESVAHLDEH